MGQVKEHHNPQYVCTATSAAAKPSPDNPAGECAAYAHARTRIFYANANTDARPLLHECNRARVHSIRGTCDFYAARKKIVQSASCGLVHLAESNPQPAGMLPCTCACSHQACHVQTCMIGVFVKHARAGWTPTCRMAPRSRLMSICLGQRLQRHLQAHAEECRWGLILLQHPPLLAPRSYTLFYDQSGDVKSQTSARQEPETLV